MTGFVFDLGALPSGMSRIRVELDAEELGLPPAAWSGPVVGGFEVERGGDRISVRGKVKAFARVECVRCLKACELAVEAPLEVFAERSGSGLRIDEEELERDDYMKFHDGRSLDLRDDAREALLLELPIAPRCREDCPGLCPRCGADLNDGPCGCAGSDRSDSPAQG
jgi:DUF177 domain-containing protein